MAGLPTSVCRIIRLLPMKFSSFASVSSRSRNTGSPAALSRMALACAFLSVPGSIVFKRSLASQSFSSPSLRTSSERLRNFSRAVSSNRSRSASLDDRLSKRLLKPGRGEPDDFTFLQLERKALPLEYPVNVGCKFRPSFGLIVFKVRVAPIGMKVVHGREGKVFEAEFL